MITVKEWIYIKHLSNEGVSISEISRKTGRDRKTIRRAIKMDKSPEYNLTKKKPSKLDPYKDFIREKLKVANFSAVVIFDEIKKMGYTGKIGILREFMKPLREEKKEKAFIRFETEPGYQAQVDWANFGEILKDDMYFKLYCFSMVLGYSRSLYIEFTTSQEIETFIRCHINAFNYFSGYTKTILYDNLKQVVNSRDYNNGEINWNEKFLDFSGYYGIKPKACWPYRACTKGKVERSIGYIRGNFFTGISFDDLKDLNRKAIDWLNNKANCRVHGTTKEIPFERLKKENLIQNKIPFDTSKVFTRIASKDCFVSYEGNRYSIPYKYALKPLTLKIKEDNLIIYHNIDEIASHKIELRKGMVIRREEHFAGILKGRNLYNKNIIYTENNINKKITTDVEIRDLQNYDRFIGGNIWAS